MQYFVCQFCLSQSTVRNLFFLKTRFDRDFSLPGPKRLPVYHLRGEQCLSLVKVPTCTLDFCGSASNCWIQQEWKCTGWRISINFPKVSERFKWKPSKELLTCSPIKYWMYTIFYITSFWIFSNMFLTRIYSRHWNASPVLYPLQSDIIVSIHQTKRHLTQE